MQSPLLALRPALLSACPVRISSSHKYLCCGFNWSKFVLWRVFAETVTFAITSGSSMI